ncbi:hypothetical protein C8R45DRAFT_923812 [Mycena sanguinolenta]|nr:hypothetical protein C8R45DRAFT_923812 [Mycena sanguinolenta]
MKARAMRSINAGPAGHKLLPRLNTCTRHARPQDAPKFRESSRSKLNRAPLTAIAMESCAAVQVEIVRDLYKFRGKSKGLVSEAQEHQVNDKVEHRPELIALQPRLHITAPAPAQPKCSTTDTKLHGPYPKSTVKYFMQTASFISVERNPAFPSGSRAKCTATPAHATKRSGCDEEQRQTIINNIEDESTPKRGIVKAQKQKFDRKEDDCRNQTSGTNWFGYRICCVAVRK